MWTNSDTFGLFVLVFLIGVFVGFVLGERAEKNRRHGQTVNDK